MFAGGFIKIAVSTKAVKKAIESDILNNFLPRHLKGQESHPASDLLGSRIHNSLVEATKSTSHKDRIGHLRDAMSDSRKLHNWPNKKKISLPTQKSKIPNNIMASGITAGILLAGYAAHKLMKKEKSPMVANNYRMPAHIENAPEKDPYQILGV